MMINYLKYTLVFFLFSIHSQEIPPIQSFQPDDYDADIQNWMITQSDDSSIVVANSSGILTFNGSWKFYESPNSTIIRSVKYIDGKIYSGKNTDFGFWSKNSKGEYSYTSIPEKFDFQLIEDEEFWDIKKLRNWIVFQSLSRLIFVDNSSQNIKVIEPGGAITKSFEIDKSLFFHMPDQGIFTVKDGSVTPFLTNKIFRDNVVINMFKIDNEYIILTEDAGFYKFINGELSEWSTDLDLNKLTVYSATLSSDNSILIGTIGSGFIKLSLSGKVVEKLNKSNGLINNTVL